MDSDPFQQGWVGVIPCVMPTAIGLPAIALCTRYGRGRLSDAAAVGPVA